MLFETDSFKNAFSSFPPSEEQLQIFNDFQHGIGDICVNAVAGSGKSKTLLGCVTLLPENASALVLAHNRKVANELSEKLRSYGVPLASNGKNGITVRTFHSFGWRTVMINRHISIDGAKKLVKETKYTDYLNDNLLSLCPESIDWKYKKKKKYLSNVENLLMYSRINLAQSAREINSVAERYSIELISNEIETVRSLMKWGKSDEVDIMDYTDLLWLPYEGDYKQPFGYDYIFVDEAQDISPAQLELIKKVLSRERKSRLIIFGDKCQAINMWCGSYEDAMDELKSCHNKPWKDFALTTNYRCGKAIIDNVNRRLREFNYSIQLKASKTASDGVLVYKVGLPSVEPKSMILCRFSAPLFEIYLNLIKMGKQVRFMNDEKDMSEILSFVNYIEGYTLEEMDNTLRCEFKNLWLSLCDGSEEGLKESAGNELLLKKYNDYKIFETLKSVCNNSADMLDMVKSLCEKKEIEKNDNAIILSTIHKAKGAEADNVYIACPSSIQSPMIDKESDWQKLQEENLEYVALTRAKNKLGFLDENQINAGKAFSGSVMILKEYKRIAKISEI